MRALLALSSATMLGGLALAVPALGEANQLQFPQMLPGQYEETIQVVSHSDNASMTTGLSSDRSRDLIPDLPVTRTAHSRNRLLE